MSYTVSEILEAADEFEENEGENLWDRVGYGTTELTINGETVIAEGVEEEGGEGSGSHKHVVFKIGDQYFRKDGYYASHYGTDWDGEFYEAEPVQVTYTEYQKKK